MRTRLIVVLLVPLTVILLALGGAYAWSVSRSIQQEFANQQLADLGYFATTTRQALRAGNPSIVESEMLRYSDLYGAEVAALDRSGAVWASGGLQAETFDEDAVSQVALALSGRRSEPEQAAFPLASGRSMLVEPVFDDGNVIGAVLISASVDAPRGEILRHWTLLVAASILVIALLMLAVLRLASWVLHPMQRVDLAMAAIEHGEMDARIDDDTGPPEMRDMIRIFNRMAEKIERVVARQQEFATNASHELRNPLGALLMRVEYLATGLDEQWDGDVEKAREEGRRMSRILDTLLSMARADHQDSPFAPVDLVEVAADRIDAWHPVARERQVRFELSGETRLMSITDRTSVESALDAVIDNALKFAPRSSAIGIAVERGNACSIVVRDHGPGVAPEELASMTDRFWRSPRDQNLPGSGLGLAIATDLMRALGGELHVSVPDDGGLRVELRLPEGESS